MNRTYQILIALLLLFGMSASAWIQPANAHDGEGTPQLDRVWVGNYLLSVWTHPSFLRTGRLHFTATVLDAGNHSPASDCRVLINLVPLERNGPALTALDITPLAYHKLVHEFEINLDTPGKYKATVQVQDLSGLAGVAEFQFEVHPEYVWMNWLKWIIIGLFIQAVLVGIWLAIDAPKVWRGSG